MKCPIGAAATTVSGLLRIITKVGIAHCAAGRFNAAPLLHDGFDILQSNIVKRAKIRHPFFVEHRQTGIMLLKPAAKIDIINCWQSARIIGQHPANQVWC